MFRTYAASGDSVGKGVIGLVGVLQGLFGASLRCFFQRNRRDVHGLDLEACRVTNGAVVHILAPLLPISQSLNPKPPKTKGPRGAAPKAAAAALLRVKAPLGQRCPMPAGGPHDSSHETF